MKTIRTDSYKGFAIATIIIGLWLLCLWIGLRINVHEAHIVLLASLVLVQTFLYTGLFITAHDAMHGSVARHFRTINAVVGYLCVALYALFSYKKLWHKHWEHHRHVATPNADPDFHDGEHIGFVRWYCHFVMNYVGWKQLVGMALVFNLLHHVAHLPIENLLLFWVVPSLASTVQLFLFGTYLPHREPLGGHQNRHRSNANNWNVLWSFLSCYHFGYHYEHHDTPSTPWWKLPAMHRATSADQRNLFV